MAREKPMLIGDLLTWHLDENREVSSQADYEAWCRATTHWSFGDSVSDTAAEPK